jgi:glycosyltransferase involved in cell wall biosynthesis
LINRVGLVQLLDALARVPDHARRLHVKIAGRGPMEAELRRRIAKLGLQDTVEMLGFISERELVAAYQGADLTILPTQALEGFGTIISESLACGTPVAVTPVGGMPEALASFSPQLIARSPGAEDIAALLDAAASQRIVLPDRVAARRYAVEHYAWPNVYSRVRAVFEQAMRERN